jgi:hypothetical protein
VSAESRRARGRGSDSRARRGTGGTPLSSVELGHRRASGDGADAFDGGMALFEAAVFGALELMAWSPG